MPAFGDPAAPANSNIGAAYVERTAREIAVPNIVTAVLASYRGFDTLGETMVIFTAGLGVMLLLGVGSGRRAQATEAARCCRLGAPQSGKRRGARTPFDRRTAPPPPSPTPHRRTP
jgi:hypothetical protein